MENVLIFTGIIIGLFFLLRSVNMWYWKIDEHLDNQREMISLLKEIKQNNVSPQTVYKGGIGIRKNENGETSLNDPNALNALLDNLPKKH